MKELESKAESMETALKEARVELKAREDLLLQIFNELGNLPLLLNTGPNISEILGVQTRPLDERERPAVLMDIEWTKRFEGYVCVFINVQNDSNLVGVVNCSVGIMDDYNANRFTSVKYVVLPDNSEADNKQCINSKSSRKLMAAINIEVFQSPQSACTLFIDWMFLPPDAPKRLKCAPQFLAQLNTTKQKFLPLNYSFYIALPLNSWPSTIQNLENVLEIDAKNILFCWYLTRHFQIIKQSSFELHTILEQLDEDHFELIDYGVWQLALGHNTSVWSDVVMYIAPDGYERFLPKQSIAFASNEMGLRNFGIFLNNKSTTK